MKTPALILDNRRHLTEEYEEPFQNQSEYKKKSSFEISPMDTIVTNSINGSEQQTHINGKITQQKQNRILFVPSKIIKSKKYCKRIIASGSENSDSKQLRIFGLNFENEPKTEERTFQKHKNIEHNFITHNKLCYKDRAEMSNSPLSLNTNDFFNSLGTTKMQSICANNVLFSTGITLKNRDPTDIASKNTGYCFKTNIRKSNQERLKKSRRGTFKTGRRSEFRELKDPRVNKDIFYIL